MLENEMPKEMEVLLETPIEMAGAVLLTIILIGSELESIKNK